MTVQDVLQIGRKLKHPQIREWVHSKKGSDYYYSGRGTKERLTLLARLSRKQTKNFFIAYKGYEYTPKAFLRKFPQFRLKKKITTKKLIKKLKKHNRKRKKR